ncbi:MAG: hypothetical protein QW046_00320, partial [Candidatus Micrarchaeaceae archaeon]
SSTIGIFSLSNVYNKLYNLILVYSVGTTNNSKGILKIYSIKFVSAQANIFNGLNFGRNYSNIVIHNSTMLIYFNYTKNITWNWYQATTTGNMSLNTSFYDYLIVNYTLTPNTNLYFYADGENGKIIPLPLLYTEELGSSTIGIFSLSNVYNKLYNLILVYSVGTTNNSKGILKIYSIKFAMGISSIDTIEIMYYNNQSINRYVSTDYSLLSQNFYELKNISYFKISILNPTSFKILINATSNINFTLVFSEEFNIYWDLYSKDNINYNLHIKVNDFLNGWILNLSKGFYVIYIQFLPQKTLEKLSYVSLTFVFGVIFTIFIIEIYKRRI